ncbi:uncharacterized protein LACBIDRAFT_312424 [Laccaria bicolor S238N-H82]|uniref:Predicted protein n=1 Tax=Laccaria bicolor (strain S238N-H82 / ATCC MYA-4686) TaxID=486041 RepID=B0DW46_LACBS|nr:uncharacterized protein LACBIDRAFT_312424 [Laccaria bicolor S238N-H82]EDR01117.1 predicted protein [Laccaria bicolor S238N-H82]|eukprot:XP_001888159.1 predicted protein [Laccaria bicolor S238N-H82]
MFAKLSLLAFVAPLVSALTVSNPTNPTSGGQMTISWTTAAGDPDSFSIELINTSFNNAFAIANNVDPSTGSITLTLPVVPVGAGYTIEFVDIGDINKVYTTSGSFSIGANSASSTSASTAASSSGTSKASTATTSSGSSSAHSTSTSGSVSSTSTSISSTSAGSSSAPAATQFSAASRLFSYNSAAVVLSMIAGAVGVTL